MNQFWKKLSFLLPLFSFLLLLYSVFSYSLTDPNLVLSTWPPFWQFQQWMWSTFFANSFLLSSVYASLILSLFAVYGLIIRRLQSSSLEYQKSSREYLLLYLLIALPLFFSYNALSHDVFNYIFNAKMLVVYHANPHVQVALDFPSDPWTRFMHNTHTPAPYGYGWTLWSVIPFVLGVGKFLLTWLSFRMWSLLSICLLFWVMQYMAKVFSKTPLQSSQLALVFLNPLFMIELISNMHNDLWMIVPAMLGLALVASLNPKVMRGYGKLWAAVGLCIFSISVKYATLVLVPIFLTVGAEKGFLLKVFNFTQWGRKLARFVPVHLITFVEQKFFQVMPLLSSILLFLPLLTNRSQQFLPWYLVWSLVWVPFIKQRWWKDTLLLFSLTAMLRYVPWLLTGGFEGNVILYQKILTFVPVLVVFAWLHRRKQLKKYQAAVTDELVGL